MPTKTSQEVEFGPENPAEVVIEVGRMPDGEGVRLFVKSKFFHQWFKARAINEVEVPEWGIKIFGLKKLPSVPEASLTNPGGSINEGGLLNLTWLRCTTLDEGMTLDLEGVVPAEPNINSLYNSIRKGIADLWSNHIRRITLRAKMTFTEITDPEVK